MKFATFLNFSKKFDKNSAFFMKNKMLHEIKNLLFSLDICPNIMQESALGS